MNDFKFDTAPLHDDLIALRRDLHRHPEIAFQEFRTAGIVAAALAEAGLEVQTQVGQTGVVGILEGAHEGPTLLLRCDMDALPISEATGADYSSTVPNMMHACGHDGHTAIMLSLAKLLAPHQAALHGRLKFVFQPAEESGYGAKAMIDDGVLADPAPDLFLGLHLWNELPLGQVAVVPGPVMAGCDVFTVEIQGRGGHAAVPDQSHDPIMAMVQAISSLQTIVSRNVDPTETAVISVTRIVAGETFNIIPDTVRFYGTIRTFEADIRQRVIERFHTVVEQTAALMQCAATVEMVQLTPPVVNDAQIANRLFSRFQATLPELEYTQGYRTMAAEDASVFLERLPGVFLMVGSANAARQLDYPHHHPKFDFDEAALASGLALLASAVSEFLLPVES